MGAKVDNPQAGDLVLLKHDPLGSLPWLVTDFFPWGCGGKHAWAVQNTTNGRKLVVFKVDIEKVG